MNFRSAIAVLLAASSTTLVASGQQAAWVDDPQLGEGPGLAMGNFELHPSFAAEFGYDSNYLRRGEGDLDAEEEPRQLPIIETLRLRLTPSLTISTAKVPRSESSPPPLVLFKLNTAAALGYNIFIPLEDTDEFDDRSRLGGGFGAGFEVFPYRPVTWDVKASYNRTVDPSSVATGEFDYDRHTLAAGTGVTWRPGGGLFEWRVGYDWRGTYFSEADFDALNNGQHTISTNGRWRFLPRTAWLYDGSYRFIRYTNLDDPDVPPGGEVQTDGEVIRSRLGIAGLLSSRFAFRAMAGWAASFYRPRGGFDPQNFDGLVGNAEIKWFLASGQGDPSTAAVRLSSIALGYDHDYAHSYLGSFYAIDRGYLNFRYFLAGAVVTSLEGYLAYITYPDLEIAGLPYEDVSETRVGAKLFAEYRASSNVGINTTLAYDQNISETEFLLAPGQNGSQDALRYKRFQAFIGGRVFW